MRFRIGTFNVNNLFDRFDDPFTEDVVYRGRSTVQKQLIVRHHTARRILKNRPDVLALQEVENRRALWEFNEGHLGRYFSYLALVEANDIRGIDVAVASRVPLGRVVTHQFRHDRRSPRRDHLVFSRDLLHVEILHRRRLRVMFHLFVTHLKSSYTPYRRPSERWRKKRDENNAWRKLQAETVRDIIKETFSDPLDTPYVVAGDLNDGPTSEFLVPLLGPESGLELYNPLVDWPLEQRTTHEHTERWTENGERHRDVHDEQYDYLLLSPPLRDRIEPGSVRVESRVGPKEESSDHNPVFLTLNL